MTRKHFEKVAEILQNAEIDSKTRETLAREFSSMFKRENPRFKQERFFRACGLADG